MKKGAKNAIAVDIQSAHKKSAMKIYTRSGDKGTTGLFGGRRVSKDSLAVESYGSVDELTSALGVFLTYISDKEERLFIVEIQKNLYILMGYLAQAPVSVEPCKQHVVALEKKIDCLSKELAPLHTFIIPGGSPASAWAHVVRTICRRTERSVIRLFHESNTTDKEEPSTIIQYLNRLSDLLFTYARYYNEQNELSTKK